MWTEYLLLSIAGLINALDNGLAVTPQMGWNNYNHYRLPTETLVLGNAHALVDFGLDKLGYVYVTIDDGWSGPTRLEDGSLSVNPTRFPRGMKAVGDRIHALGLKFGVYSNAGLHTCARRVGSLNHELADAKQFASWGADSLKYDNCYSDARLGYPAVAYKPSAPILPRMKAMADAIQAAGRPMLYQVCDWGVDFPSAWAPGISNSWRITNDITKKWASVYRIINQAVPQTSFAGPGAWLDLDMLEIGNNVYSFAGEQTQMSLWAIIKSPLIIGAGLKDTVGGPSVINSASLGIYKNAAAVSYNQDKLGVAASFTRRWTADQYDVWSGPLSGGRVVASVTNWANQARVLSLDLPDIGLQTAKSVKSAWTGRGKTIALTSYSEMVPAHGTMLVELVPGDAAGFYGPAFATVAGGVTTFTNVYGVTTSSAYSMKIKFRTSVTAMITVAATCDGETPHKYSSNGITVTVPVALCAGAKNTVSITATSAVDSIVIKDPTGTYYPSTAFAAFGCSKKIPCHANLCKPVGSKINFVDPTSGGRISISAPTNLKGTKMVLLDYCQNDIALAKASSTGTNTRNSTITVNGVTTRVDLPLTGRSSETFSPGLGWEDSSTFKVLVDGFGTGAGHDVVEFSNVGGEAGVQRLGADFVGMRVLW